MLPFDRCPSALALRQLAAKAPHLNDESFLTEERLRRAQCSGADWTIYWGTQRVDERIQGALWDLASERNCVAALRGMQAGAIVNHIEGATSENRAALHSSLRAVHELPQEGPEGVRRRSRMQIDRIGQFLSEIGETFSHLLIIGIGGSELGPSALFNGLKAVKRTGRILHFVSSLDPDEIHLALAACPPKTTLVASISKSGSTLETLTNEAILRGEFRARGLDDRQHFVSISVPGTALDDATRYRAHFDLDETIGGRLSSTSAIGALIIGFTVGLEAFEEVLAGAAAMDQLAASEDFSTNLPLWLALLGIWNRNFLGYPHLAILPYSRALGRLTAHLQQLDMESNGKRIDKGGRPVDFATGPLIWGEPGTNAQHSIGQWLHQGTDICPVEFIGCLRPQRGPDFTLNGVSSQQKLLCNLFAQALALARGQPSDNPNRQFPGDRPSALLLTEQLTPKALGALWSLYENKVALQGFIWNVNSFDQEGVQLGKGLANQFIEGVKAGAAGEPISALLGRHWIERAIAANANSKP